MSAADSTSSPCYRGILGFARYRVGDDGSVWSWRKQAKTWKRLAPFASLTGYLQVSLYRDLKRFRKYVHQIVLETFVGPCPPGLECRHLDGDKTNNAAINLAWGTRSENMADMMRHGTWRRPPGRKTFPAVYPSINRGSSNGRSKVSENDVLEFHRLRAAGHKPREIAQRAGLTVEHVRRILRGEKWCHLLQR
jgi:hypothetical protein